MKPISTHPFPSLEMELTFVPGSFDQGIAFLESRGLELATAQQIARCRMAAHEIGDEHVLNLDCWTSESYVYIPDHKILLTSRECNPIFSNLEAAIEAHRSFKEFFVDVNPLKQALQKGSVDLKYWDFKNFDEPAKMNSSLADASRNGVIILGEMDQQLFLPLQIFKTHPVARFLYRESLTFYASFLESQGIETVYHSFVPMNAAQLIGSPFARPVWSVGISKLADLNGCAPPLVAEHGAVCGIRKI